jgi:Zn-finger nucleic acid-binding protein
MKSHKDTEYLHCKNCNEDVEAVLEEYASPTYSDPGGTIEAYYCPKCDEHIVDCGELESDFEPEPVRKDENN